MGQSIYLNPDPVRICGRYHGQGVHTIGPGNHVPLCTSSLVNFGQLYRITVPVRQHQELKVQPLKNVLSWAEDPSSYLIVVNKVLYLKLSYAN